MPDDPSTSQVPPPHPRRPGDGWVDCACGARHWGLVGAAGLLLARVRPDGEVADVLLQHRALWSHQGGTWGIPGGAREPGETAEQAALREAAEEAGVRADGVRVLGVSVLTHPDWSYTTVLARQVGELDAYAADAESIEVRRVEVAAVADLPLHGAFAAAWPDLLARLRVLLD